MRHDIEGNYLRGIAEDAPELADRMRVDVARNALGVDWFRITSGSLPAQAADAPPFPGALFHRGSHPVQPSQDWSEYVGDEQTDRVNNRRHPE